MASGWLNTVVAEARERIERLYAGIKDYNSIQTLTRDTENYHRDATNLQSASKDKLIALSADLDSLRIYIDENSEELENLTFYSAEVDTIAKIIAALNTGLVTPSITTEEASKEIIIGICNKVDDGDTIYVGDVEWKESDPCIRLAGIDAPEKGTAAGIVAMQFLDNLVLGKEVTVYIDPHNPTEIYGRVLGTVYYNDPATDTPINLSVEMVSQCLAVPLLKFGKNKYVDPDEINQAHKMCVVGWPKIGVIKIVSAPAKASVWVDGMNTTEVTPTELELPIGIHHIVLSLTGRSSVHDDVVVDGVRRELPPYVLPALGVDVGAVEIHVLPRDKVGIVSIDGVVVGVSPVFVDLDATMSHSVVAQVGGVDSLPVAIKPRRGEIVRQVIDTT